MMRVFILCTLAFVLLPSTSAAESAEAAPQDDEASGSTPSGEENVPSQDDDDIASAPEDSPEQAPGEATTDVPSEVPDGSPADDAATESAEQQQPAPVEGLSGPALDVAFARSVSSLQAGDRLEPARSVVVPDGGCLRVVAGLSAAVALRGPAQANLTARGDRIVLSVSNGRGLLSADETGGALEVAGQHVEVRNGTVSFDTSSSPVAVLISGEMARIGDEPISEGSVGPNVSELLSMSFCAPPRQAVSITLGDPTGLIEETAQARAQGSEGGEEAATAEGGATCVDSADSSSATDPSQGTDGGIDPDARRDEDGTLRLTIRLPR